MPSVLIADQLPLTDLIQVAEVDSTRFAALCPMNARPAHEAQRRFVLRSA